MNCSTATATAIRCAVQRGVYCASDSGTLEAAVQLPQRCRLWPSFAAGSILRPSLSRVVWCQHLKCAPRAALRRCHTAVPRWPNTATLSFDASAATRSESDVEAVFTPSPPAAAKRGDTRKKVEAQRRRHRRRRGSHEPRQASSSVRSTAERDHVLQSSPTQPSTSPFATRYPLSDLEKVLCQHLRRNELGAAVALLQQEQEQHEKRSEHPTFTGGATKRLSSAVAPAHLTSEQKQQQPTDGAVEKPEWSVASRSGSATAAHASLAEECLYLLLWCGEEAAAWGVWQTMRTAPPLSSSRSSACIRNAQTVLVLTLFLHFGVRDKLRTRDTLLLLEMTWKAGADVAVKGGSRTSASTSEVWTSLFVAWLRCVVRRDPERPSNACAAMRNAASRRMAACLEEDNVEGARVAALLLLSVPRQPAVAAVSKGDRETRAPDADAANRLRPHASPPSLSTSSAVQTTLDLVEEEFARRSGDMTWLPVQRPPRVSERTMQDTPPNSLLSSVEHRGEGQTDKQALSRQRRHRIQACFAAAARQLSKLPHTANKDSVTHANHDPRSPADLTTYHFWFRQLMKALGCAELWAALVEASVNTSAAVNSPGKGIKDGGDLSAVRRRLQRINEATDRGDWEAALRLCCLEHAAECLRGDDDCDEGKRSSSSSVPWLRLLRKGLAACEAAARTNGVVPWHGVLALWHAAQNHQQAKSTQRSSASRRRSVRGDSHAGALIREYGRMFVLLASATRWAEALQCFYETPTASLDGFSVAQVGYALRASAAHHDRAVLDLWAAWRCRCGDRAEPTAELVVQLLQAMLHSAAAGASGELAREVATGLLVAAAETTEEIYAEGKASTASLSPRLPGTRVPLDWQHRRHLVHRILADRWSGTWAAALQVAVASGDVALLRLVAPRVPPPRSSSSRQAVSLYADTVLRLRERGVELTAADRAALWTLWGNTQPRSEKVQHAKALDEATGRVGSSVYRKSGTEALHPGDLDVAQVTRNAESLLDDLLGEEAPHP